MSEIIDRELGWDDEIQNDGTEFVVLPEGDCDFEVTSFERGRHQGSDKLPPCNKAIISIKLTAQDGQTATIKHNLFLHSKTEGMLCAFFTAIGQRQKGQKVTMNWNAVVGSTGRCKVKIRRWTSNNGNPMENNEIAKFYDKEAHPQTVKSPWEAGNF